MTSQHRSSCRWSILFTEDQGAWAWPKHRQQKGPTKPRLLGQARAIQSPQSASQQSLNCSGGHPSPHLTAVLKEITCQNITGKQSLVKRILFHKRKDSKISKMQSGVQYISLFLVQATASPAKTVLPSCACYLAHLRPDIYTKNGCARITALEQLPFTTVSKWS